MWKPDIAGCRKVTLHLVAAFLATIYFCVMANTALANPSATPGAKPAISISENEALVLKLVNDERKAAGLFPLQLDQSLCNVARLHAIDMIESGFFGHQSPKTGTLAKRLGSANIDFSRAGENLAGNSSIRAAHRMLMDSPPHKGNILDPEFTELGVAVVGGGPYGMMIVEVFAVPESHAADRDRKPVAH